MFHLDNTVFKREFRRGLGFISLALILLILFSGSTFAQTAQFTASDGEPDDNFGYTLAVSGNTMVVGAWQNDSLRANSGAAYVLENGTTDGWQHVAKLIPDNADFAGDEFGKAVAIDGDFLVVGAQFDDTLDKDRGAVYVFKKTPDAETPWTQVAKLTSNDTAFRDFFGQTVAISGTRVVVGAPEDDSAGKQQGAVYIFELDSTDDSWNQVAKLSADDGEANDLFGSAVAIHDDTVLVGAAEHSVQDVNNTGAAYVFAYAGGSWSQVTKLTAGDGDEKDRFGFAVALSGDRALVGAPFDDDSENPGGSVYVFERPVETSSWSQVAKLTAAQPKLGNQFGRSVALFGERALIGSPGDDDNGKESGAAYLFALDEASGTWNQLDKFTADGGATFDEFGMAVSLSDELALVGSHQSDVGDKDDSGSVHVFPLGF